MIEPNNAVSRQGNKAWPETTRHTYKNGKYYLFEKRQILVMSVWPDPRAWRKTKTQPWNYTTRHADMEFSSFQMNLPEFDQLALLRNVVESWERNQKRVPEEERCDYSALKKTVSLATTTEDFLSEDFPWPVYLSTEDRKFCVTFNYGEHAKKQFLQHIPKEIRSILDPIQECRWQMLNLLARCPGAVDLSLSNPALAFALANNRCFHRPAVSRPYRSARWLVARKQKEIAAWLGFPATPIVVRILAKVDPYALSVKRLYFLKAAMMNAGILKLLAHLPVINIGVLELLGCADIRNRLTYTVLHEASQIDYSPYCVERLKSLIFDTRNLSLQFPEIAWPANFRNMEQIQNFHDHLTVCLIEQQSKSFDDMQDYPLPPPPFPGNEHIQPIKTAKELRMEGMQMRHCIGSYLERVLRNEVYAYRVMAPIRATLSIRRNKDGHWMKAEVSQYGNERVPESMTEQLYADLFGMQ